MNNELTTETVELLACSIDYTLDLMHDEAPEYELRMIVEGMTFPLLRSTNLNNENISSTVRTIVQGFTPSDDREHPDMGTVTYDELCLLLYPYWFAKLHDHGDYVPCMACGATWVIDYDAGDISIEHHVGDCGYWRAMEVGEERGAAEVRDISNDTLFYGRPGAAKDVL